MTQGLDVSILSHFLQRIGLWPKPHMSRAAVAQAIETAHEAVAEASGLASELESLPRNCQAASRWKFETAHRPSMARVRRAV